MTPTVFDNPESIRINEARLSHLRSLGLPLSGRAVLEVGAGVGLLTGFFEQLGCKVVSVDARRPNVEENLLRHPGRTALVADLDESDCLEGLGRFEVVFCYGLLYHLAHPAQAIVRMAGACTDLLLVETCVNPVDNGLVNPVAEPNTEDQSACGLGCRPARDWVLDQLRKAMPHAYAAATQPGHPQYPTSWPADGDRARAVFVASRHEIRLPSLCGELPATQESLQGSGPCA